MSTPAINTATKELHQICANINVDGSAISSSSTISLGQLYVAIARLYNARSSVPREIFLPVDTEECARAFQAASASHPFFSSYVSFGFIEEHDGVFDAHNSSANYSEIFKFNFFGISGCCKTTSNAVLCKGDDLGISKLETEISVHHNAVEIVLSTFELSSYFPNQGYGGIVRVSINDDSCAVTELSLMCRVPAKNVVRLLVLAVCSASRSAHKQMRLIPNCWPLSAILCAKQKCQLCPVCETD